MEKTQKFQNLGIINSKCLHDEKFDILITGGSIKFFK